MSQFILAVRVTEMSYGSESYFNTAVIFAHI